ncbi:Nucleoside-diphosphate-sugar epimerase [Litoreibacter ascidiaceicola]|uniref:Nucleoside-diphosphate-sugar epimerase n=1 Tax=Litoreibacter ascidiaceicola TaxID=1486859 RepID=A0A1M4ZR95_9RHOB|nr:D-erythronate dehydrogenase [Litoreibacter ascidiaceicola]SHF20327.1 Nucleoside-diphosphate-sugar epimerase [Litoreibacter ascidiaceicola]
MRALILGGGGMVGQKLARHIAANGLNGQPVDITLHDIAFPSDPVAGAAQIKGSIADAGTPETLAKTKPDVIFHLASIVSGEAEADFTKGWAINMHPTWELLEALRAEHEADPSYRPRIVFTSSIAVFGGPYPDKISDDFLSAPQTSYGAQKSICETMISDFSRKGFIDGISIRLPTICVRPGKPNAAASSFFSGIIREPLNGQEAILPVADTTRHWHASPRSATGFLTHAATLDTDLLQNRRALNLPGVSCTVAEQIEALRDLAGNDVVKLIKPQPDPVIQKIVEGWPRNFAPERALALGFKAESSFKEIIQVYLDDDLKRPI